MDKDFQERVRARAHLLWEQEGRPEGKAEEHWRRAASLVGEEDAGPAPANLNLTEMAADDTGARRSKAPSSPRKAASVSKTRSVEAARPAIAPAATTSKRTPKPAS